MVSKCTTTVTHMLQLTDAFPHVSAYTHVQHVFLDVHVYVDVRHR